MLTSFKELVVNDPDGTVITLRSADGVGVELVLIYTPVSSERIVWYWLDETAGWKFKQKSSADAELLKHVVGQLGLMCGLDNLVTFMNRHKNTKSSSVRNVDQLLFA
jgi:hypothetical protein